VMNLLLHYIKWGKTEIIFSKTWNWTRKSILPTVIQYSIGVLRHNKKVREKIKMDSNREGRI
jgi:hypothetical protein